VKREKSQNITQRTQAAVDELRALILATYPDARFAVGHGDDPPGVRLRAIVDVEDIDEVIDLVMDKLYEIQVERGLPVYIIPSRPPERLAEQLANYEHERRATMVGGLPV